MALAVIVSGAASPRSAGASSGAEPEATPTCFGETATIVGTDEDDTLVGTLGRDVIVGLAGSDDIRGLAGDDLICAGDNGLPGRSTDTVQGGPGNDRIDGGPGVDRIYGDDGDDHILLGANHPVYVRWEHADGGAGDDVLDGGSGRDDLQGGAGNDTLKGRGGADNLLGHGGDDVMWGGAGPDRLMDYSGSVDDLTSETRNVLRGGRGHDFMRSGPGADSLFGGPGDDTLYGTRTGQTLRGGAGHDLLVGTDGNDDLVGGRGIDLASFACSDIPGDGCEDPVRADLAAGRVSGRGDDELRGIEGIRGSDGRDVLLGNGKRNVFVVTPGDVVRGRAGSDVVAFEDISEFGERQGAVVDLAQDTARWRDVDTRVVSIERVIGTLLDDTLLGDSDRNVLFGWDGDDTIRGRGGADLLAGELSPFGVPFLRHLRVLHDPSGRDALFGGPGDDRLFGERENDRLDGGSGRNHNNGGGGTDACVRPGPRHSADCETR